VLQFYIGFATPLTSTQVELLPWCNALTTLKKHYQNLVSFDYSVHKIAQLLFAIDSSLAYTIKPWSLALALKTQNRNRGKKINLPGCPRIEHQSVRPKSAKAQTFYINFTLILTTLYINYLPRYKESLSSTTLTIQMNTSQDSFNSKSTRDVVTRKKLYLKSLSFIQYTAEEVSGCSIYEYVIVIKLIKNIN